MSGAKDTRAITIEAPCGNLCIINADVLVQRSAYFRGALSGGFAESQSLRFSLSEHATPWTLFVLSEWARSQDQRFFYLDTIKPKFYAVWTRDSWPKCDYAAVAWYRTLVETWLLADYLIMPSLQNHIMEALVRFDFDALVLYSPAIYHDDITKCLGTLNLASVPKLYDQYCHALARSVIRFFESVGGTMSYDECDAIFHRWDEETRDYVYYRVLDIQSHRNQGLVAVARMNYLLLERGKVAEPPS